MINVCKIFKSRKWSPVCAATINRTYAKKLSSIPSVRGGGGKREKPERLLQSSLRYRLTQNVVLLVCSAVIYG